MRRPRPLLRGLEPESDGEIAEVRPDRGEEEGSEVESVDPGERVEPRGVDPTTLSRPSNPPAPEVTESRGEPPLVKLLSGELLVRASTGEEEASPPLSALPPPRGPTILSRPSRPPMPDPEVRSDIGSESVRPDAEDGSLAAKRPGRPENRPPAESTRGRGGRVRPRSPDDESIR